jgi:hypothetical protein
MRKQFETRVRLVIYMDARDLNRLTERAKREGRVLVAWAREVLMERLECKDFTVESAGRALQMLPTKSLKSLKKQMDSKPLVASFTDRASITDPELAKEIADFNPDIFTTKHTAQSNRLTCRCATCSEYRRIHDLPLGWLKRAKK